MREFAVPIQKEIEPADNLTVLPVRNAEVSPDSVAFQRRRGERWEDVTSRQFLSEVVSLAKGLIAAGVQPGDRIGLMSKTCYEWTLFDVAIWFAGAITVPIYETSSVEQVRWILSDAGVVGCVVETADHETDVRPLLADLPDLKNLWVLEAGAVDDLQQSGRDIGDDQVARRRGTLTADSVATLIYTSGTTGRPKGCVLTHGNFLASAENARLIFGDLLGEGKRTVLFLPLAHVFARYIEVLCLVSRSTMAHSPRVATVMDDLAAVQPTFLLSVPRVFEKIYNSSEAKADAAGGVKSKIFHRAVAVACQYSESLDSGGPALPLKLQHVLFDRLVYSKLRAAMGGKIEKAVSGGAPLGARLGHFYRGAGILVLEGWGLTETTAPASVNTEEKQKIGSVGQPLPGVAVRVADDGELQVKGICNMREYLNNPAATAEAMTDGWFRTGDLGEIDGDGFVKITGRRKEILITSGGKNVVPGVLEDRLRAHPLISQTMVVGDQRPFIACLITLDAEMLPGWLANRGKPALTVEQARTDPDVRAELQKAVDDANLQVSKAEAIKSFVILDADWTEASGHLTPKMSLKRPVVMKDYGQQIEELYSR